MEGYDKKLLVRILKELAKIRNPHLNRDFSEKELDELFKKVKDGENISKLSIPISKKSFLELVTSRNRNLIKEADQKKLLETTIAFFGMSVGSSVAIPWVAMSRADNVKIIDPDVLDATNLNRLFFGFESLGRLKIDVIKELLLKINPFINVRGYTKIGVKKMEETIFAVNPKINLIVDEMDDIEAKIELRRIAAKHRLPLVSAADVGDMTLLDIERHDVENKVLPFLGKLGDVRKINFSEITPLEKKKLIIKLVGFDNNSETMLESLMSIGGTITTWPQLGATASMTGGIAALAIKKIILGEKIKSGRYFVSLDKILVEDFDQKDRKINRERMVTNIKQVLKI